MTLFREVQGLAGWGHTTASWEPLAAVLEGLGLTLAGAALPGMDGKEVAPESCTLGKAAACLPEAPDLLLGWSLGGLAVLEGIRQNRIRPGGLVLIATPPRFIGEPGYPAGMDPARFAAFREGIAEDYPATLRRFYALQFLGDRAPRSRWAAQSARDRFLAVGAGTTVLAAWLEALAAADLTSDPPELSAPTLVLHGAADAVVDPAALDFFRGCGPAVSGHTIAGAGHAPHISHPVATGQRIAEFARALAG